MYKIVKNYATGTNSSQSSILKAKFWYEVGSLAKESEIIDRMDLRKNGKLLKNYIENKLDVSYTGSHNPYSFDGNGKVVEISYLILGFGFNLKISTNQFQNLAEMINLYELDLLIEDGIKLEI